MNKELQVGKIYKIKPEHVVEARNCSGFEKDRIEAHSVRILSILIDGSINYEGLDKYGNKLGQCGGCVKQSWLIINSNYMDALEQFALILKSEPEKSFRKLGITNGDDILTEEGQKIFLSWLLSKNKNDFKKEVVDPILEEKKEECK